MGSISPSSRTRISVNLDPAFGSLKNSASEKEDPLPVRPQMPTFPLHSSRFGISWDGATGENPTYNGDVDVFRH